jgi:hypothetical protein
LQQRRHREHPARGIEQRLGGARRRSGDRPARQGGGSRRLDRRRRPAQAAGEQSEKRKRADDPRIKHLDGSSQDPRPPATCGPVRSTAIRAIAPGILAL